jgi:hypothetical protein
MLESWNFLSSSSDIFGMLCLVLLSGRTKYDFLVVPVGFKYSDDFLLLEGTSDFF